MTKNTRENKTSYYHKITRIVFFGGLFFIMFLFIKRISTILTPFVIAFLISYLFSPLSIRMNHKFKINKNLSAGIIVFVIQILLILILTVGTPVLYSQIVSVAGLIPEISQFFETKILPLIPFHLSLVYEEATKNFNISNTIKETFANKDFWTSAYNSGMVIINLISTTFLVPILTFYMIRDWGKIHKSTLNLIPVHYKTEFEIIVHEIRKKVSAYIVGETLVIIILTFMYGIGLSLTGLKFGFLIGMLTAILSIVPYVGFTLCFISALLIAFATKMSYFDISMISSVFIIVQIAESNYIVPKLVGSKVGLHPLWIIFGLFAGGSLLGFIGLLLAIPITTVTSVLIKHYIKKYKHSEYYED